MEATTGMLLLIGGTVLYQLFDKDSWLSTRNRKLRRREKIEEALGTKILGGLKDL